MKKRNEHRKRRRERRALWSMRKLNVLNIPRLARERKLTIWQVEAFHNFTKRFAKRLLRNRTRGI